MGEQGCHVGSLFFTSHPQDSLFAVWIGYYNRQNFATQYCRANWHSDAAYLGYGVATASHQGKFPSKDNCDEVFSDIINMCLGISNGAYEGLGDARLVVSFGSCEVV